MSNLIRVEVGSSVMYITPPPDQPVATTKVVTMKQAQLALFAAGKLDAVNAAIAALPSPDKELAQIEWDKAATVQRDSDLVSLLGQAVGLSDADIDALFAAAALIP